MVLLLLCVERADHAAWLSTYLGNLSHQSGVKQKISYIIISYLVEIDHCLDSLEIKKEVQSAKGIRNKDKDEDKWAQKARDRVTLLMENPQRRQASQD